jgi:hypothetical protein
MKLRISLFVTSVVAATCLLSTPAAKAQNVYAAIHGTVTDTSGAVVANATVSATNNSTTFQATVETDSRGYYVFPQLPIGGPYTIRITATGFQGYISNGTMLNLNDNLSISAQLEIGSTSQTIQVQASAVQVETSDTQLKQVISADEIEELPLLARSAISLQKTTPGVMESSDRFGNFSTNGSQTQENSYLLDGTVINDGPLEDQEISINPDALAEFNVVSSTLNPEFSRNSGAILNEVIKSGTNQFHGSGFEFYRDTFLNNGNYFSAPGTRPQYHKNDYGGTFGGPLFKSRTFFFLAYEGFRARTAATTDTPVPASGVIASGNFTPDQNLFTSATNAGGLSTNPIPFAMTGPTGTCAAGTPWNVCFAPNASGQVIVPTSNYNAIAATLTAKYVPAPNFSIGGTPYYNFNAPDTAAQDQGIIRIDEQISRNDLFWASSVFQSAPTTEALPFGGATLPGFTEIDASHIKLFTGDYTHTFNPSTLNELRAGYFRYYFAAVEPLTPMLPSSAGFVGITPQFPSAAGLPVMGLEGLFTLGFSFEGPQPRHDANYDLADNFSKVLGNHNLKLGVHYERFSVDNPYYDDNSGDYSYEGSGAFSSGDPLIDYMLGIPDGYEQASGGIINAHSAEYYAYAQDNWKLTNDLTANYGLAWDTETPYANVQYGGEGIFCWAPTGQSKVFPTAPPGMLYPGDPGCNVNGGPTTKYDHFGPRVGFDWSPSSGPGRLIGTPGSHLFAVRGGFGLYFNRDSEESSLQNLADAPFGISSGGATSAGGSPGFTDPYVDVAGRPGLSVTTNPFPFTPPAVGAPVNFNSFEPMFDYSIAPNYNVPYTYNFNLNVQRELPSNMLAQIGYVGSLGRNLVRAYEADQVTAAGHAAAVADPTCVTYKAVLSAACPQDFTQPGVNSAGLPYYYTVGRTYTNGSSNYNALQVGLTKGPTHGLYFTLAYTYSHGLDDASGYESSFGGGDSGGAVVNQIPGYQYLGYGDSDYDARHRFVALYNYGIPLFSFMNDHAPLRETLGGWHFTGITTLQTGFPIGIFQTGNDALWCNGTETSYFGCSDVPNTSSYTIPTLNPRNTGHYWFNPSPFSSETIGSFGDVKRNFFHGPGFNYSNMELYKNFPLGGADSPRFVQLRLETYNTFNHSNFALPDGEYGTGEFGQISNVIQPGTGDPQPGRAVQLAGKFYF